MPFDKQGPGILYCDTGAFGGISPAFLSRRMEQKHRGLKGAYCIVSYFIAYNFGIVKLILSKGRKNISLFIRLAGQFRKQAVRKPSEFLDREGLRAPAGVDAGHLECVLRLFPRKTELLDRVR